MVGLPQAYGYVTSADFVRGRYGNRRLALAVAFTGILATMPYIALQLVGMQVVIGAMGIETSGLYGDLPLIIAFVILAAFTYSSGPCAHGDDRDRKGDTLIYITVHRRHRRWLLIYLGGFWTDVRRGAQGQTAARATNRRHLGQFQRIWFAGTRFGLRVVALPAFDHRHPEFIQRPGGAA